MEAYSIEHCQRISQELGSRFYSASLLLPLEKRNASWAIYAFCRVSDNLVDEEKNETAFLNWKADLMDTWNGKHTHPVLSAFVSTCFNHRISPSLSNAFLNGLETDFRPAGFDHFSSLETYCKRVAGLPGLMMLRVLGGPKKAEPFALNLGVAMQLTNILRDYQTDLTEGRNYFPKDELDQFDLSASDLLAPAFESKARPFFEFQSNRAHDLYQKSIPGLSLLPPHGRFCAWTCLKNYRSILETGNRAQTGSGLG